MAAEPVATRPEVDVLEGLTTAIVVDADRRAPGGVRRKSGVEQPE